jgi:hypothetical protein
VSATPLGAAQVPIEQQERGLEQEHTRSREQAEDHGVAVRAASSANASMGPSVAANARCNCADAR